MHPFFRVGMGLPFANSLQGSRTIIFGSFNQLGRNIGVIFAWLAFTWLLTWRRHRKYRAELAEVDEQELPPLAAAPAEEAA